jgi:renalase
MSKMSVAVIGAGMSGAACAAALARAGVAVTVFDKGRGAGGRMSTRRGDTGHRFDHGAPRFSASSPEFAAVVHDWADAGVVLRRQQTQGEWYVGAGGMNAACKHLLASDGIDQRMSVRVARLVRETLDKWTLVDDIGNPYVGFDAVVSTVPAPQAAELVPLAFEALRARAAAVRMVPRWVAMYGFIDRVWPAQRDLAIVSDDSSDMAIELSRSLANTTGEAWVVQASGAWSAAHVELDAKDALQRLTERTQRVFGDRWQTPVFASAHRWRYAFVDQPLGEDCLSQVDEHLVVCGDWCCGWNVEAAWISGSAAARRVLETR